jgi:hypothetical protein
MDGMYAQVIPHLSFFGCSTPHGLIAVSHAELSVVRDYG